ncbi:MAG TPA: 50S ribosomal protein L25/general stress protein Ctc [Aestuariivirgaceae bacterium]|jgi:large subunit ribosomal protein L25
MAKAVTLKAELRDASGKGAARSVRRRGLVPGVVYGDKKEPQLLSLRYGDLLPHVNTGRFTATLVDLELGGKTVRVIPRDVQFEPVRDFIVHVDFLRLGKDARIRVEVPVHFRNHEASPGLKAGGVLNIVRHEIEFFCPADSIPEEVVVDLTGLHIGQSVHASQVKLPEGAQPTITERDFTIATIAAAAAIPVEEEAEAAPAAAEVPAIAQKAPGEDEAAAAAGKEAQPAPAKKEGGSEKKK